MHIIDVVEILGALLILAAFAGSQLRRIDAHSVPYLLLNIAGAGILWVIAAVERSWGFLLLEATWTIMSVVSLVALLRGRQRQRPTDVS